MLSGCRLSHQLHQRHHQLGFAFCSAKTIHLSCFMLTPPSLPLPTTRFYTASSNLDFGNPLVACIQSNSDIPVHPDSFSYQEDDPEPPSGQPSPVAGGIVALGKFDALHIGHRELAIQASKVGIPFLLSFVGMAEVLGWEPRAPIVAKCDRKRVLSSWAPYCGGIAPVEFQVDFSKVRYLSPQEFVDKLSKELGVHGVVAGRNYRFGFRATGDAAELVKLCQEYSLGAYIINSVMDKYQEDYRKAGYSDSKEQGQVSSTRVRHALSKGDMNYVSELLGRQHRLILVPDNERFATSDRNSVSASKSCLVNLPPKDGQYDNCSLLIDGADDCAVPCRVVIDSTHIRLDLENADDNVASAEPLYRWQLLIGSPSSNECQHGVIYIPEIRVQDLESNFEVAVELR